MNPLPSSSDQIHAPTKLITPPKKTTASQQISRLFLIYTHLYIIKYIYISFPPKEQISKHLHPPVTFHNVSTQLHSPLPSPKIPPHVTRSKRNSSLRKAARALFTSRTRVPFGITSSHLFQRRDPHGTLGLGKKVCPVACLRWRFISRGWWLGCFVLCLSKQRSCWKNNDSYSLNFRVCQLPEVLSVGEFVSTESFWSGKGWLKKNPERNQSLLNSEHGKILVTFYHTGWFIRSLVMASSNH